MSARQEILDVLARYCRGVDRCDIELIRSVYHPGATDDHGLFKGSGEDFAAFVVPLLLEHTEATMHVLGQSLIEFDETCSGAAVETYFVAYHDRITDGERWLDTVGGRYVDRFSLLDGAWKIAARTVVVDWTKVDHVDATYPTEGFTLGRRDREDMAYQ